MDITTHIPFFIELLGDKRAFFGEALSSYQHYGMDRTKKYQPNISGLLFPKNTDEVSQIVEYCYQHSLSLVPSAGRTGYAGGAVAANQEIILSFEKMNQILFLDAIFGMVTVQAGMITDELNLYLKDFGLFFPLKFAASGSSHLGANLATNAGGLCVVRYGSLRNWVLGITAVNGKGEILRLGGQFLKDNTGYDLKSLLLGSEGTLAVITEITLRLTKEPSPSVVYLMALSEYKHVLQVFQLARALPQPLNSFEFFTRVCLEQVLRFIPDLDDPFAASYPYYVLIDLEQTADGEILDEFLARLFEKEYIQDGVLAINSRQAATLWRYREEISEALSLHQVAHKNDISLPMYRLEEFSDKLNQGLAEKFSHLQVAIFGHLGDGNLHVNFLKPASQSESDFFSSTQEIDDFMYQLVMQFNGSISAEHGIGLLKKQALLDYTDSVELGIMREIKAAFDPKNILNPGKIL